MAAVVTLWLVPRLTRAPLPALTTVLTLGLLVGVPVTGSSSRSRMLSWSSRSATGSPIRRVAERTELARRLRAVPAERIVRYAQYETTPGPGGTATVRPPGP
ncbi:MAG TPA: hypothetical protein VI248_28755 [Kineosporiaceae bacterium]